MSDYYYSALSSEPDRIRLLRLLPHESDKAGIHCELFEYALKDLRKGSHLYEALSYTWGDSNKPRNISINNQNLAVTENLYTALLCLRDRSFERILWIDAVCINQENLKEQGQQVQLMAKIYSRASRVLVWLGETADNSDTALERICIAAENESVDSLNDKLTKQEIMSLLQRPWFRRIWVLQEVAAAKHILVICGSTVIDGYSFYSGISYFYEAHRDLENPIRSITYLIRGAIFRPKHDMSGPTTTTLNVRPLSELVDMFHTHEATNPVDKVYALLGMSSDDPSTGLVPDYEVTWDKLFSDLVKFILYKQIDVKILDDERAVIKSRGCVLGQVLSLKNGYKQELGICFKNMPKHLGCKRQWHWSWTLLATVKHIREGDLICLLQGASKPTIIRPQQDYFEVIRIAVTLDGKVTESGHIEWSKLLLSITEFPRDFLAIWDWGNSFDKFQDLEEYEALIRTDKWVSKLSMAGLEDHLDTATRIWNVAMILDDLEEYKKADKRLCEARRGYEMTFGREHRHPLKRQCSRAPLSWAAEGGRVAVVHVLLAKPGIEPDLTDSKSGRTPLSWAASRGHIAVVQLLLTIGKVKSDSKDKQGRTPLLWATIKGHKAIIQLLLNTAKVDINTNDYYGRSPLSIAAGTGQKDVVQLLLAKDSINPDLKDNRSGRTPLSWAAGRGHVAIVHLLLETEKVDINSRDQYSRTPLSIAIKTRHKVVIQLLLNTAKVDINTKDDRSLSPLSIAAETGQKDVVQLLLAQHGIKLGTRSGEIGWVALWRAADQGHATVVQLLLTTGKVGIDLSDQYGRRTPLWIAVSRGHWAVVQVLLETGKVNVNSKDRYGRTPLWIAVQRGHWAVVQLLLNTGKVDANLKGLSSETPLWVAANSGNSAIVELLLVIGNIDVNFKDQYGWTPLSAAAAKGHKAVVKLLLENKKTEVNTKDMEGDTPLSLAAHGGHQDVVQLLLETGKVDAD